MNAHVYIGNETNSIIQKSGKHTVKLAIGVIRVDARDLELMPCDGIDSSFFYLVNINTAH